MISTPFHCLPDREAVARMPTANTIEVGDFNRRAEAEIGSERLLAAYQRYFEKLYQEQRG